MGDEYHRPADRPLTADEVILLSWLMEHGTPDAARYADQIERVRVAAECTCGCPTIDLAVDGQPRAAGGSLIISDAVGTTPDGTAVGVILHVRGGALSELE